MKPQLDIELIKMLYDFGALLAYRVSYSNPLTLEVIHMQATLNESKAMEMLAEKKRDGFLAVMTETLIKFDGAYSTEFL